MGSATPAMHCLTAWGQWTVQLRQCTAPLPGGSGQCNSCNALPHRLGAVDSATPAMHCPTAWGQWAVQLLQCTASLPGAVGSATRATHCLTAWEQWAVQLLQCTASLPGGSGQCNSCNGWSECPAGPVGMYYPGHHPGGMGSPPQGVVGASFRAYGGPSSSENRAHRPGGGRGVQPRGWSEPPARPMGSQHLPRTGRTGLGGRGVLPRGWPEYSSGPMGRRHPRRTGRTGLGGTGSPAQGVVRVSCRAHGEAPSFKNRAHRPGGDGESSPGGGRSILQGPWGGIILQKPGAPAWGGRGAQPRGWSGHPSRPMGSHLPSRTGRTGLGGTGSPAQGVFGASCKARGEPSSFKNRAHRPGGDGESSPGGGRGILQGQWGAICFGEPGAPAWGGTGSPAQGVFGASCKAHGGPSLSENRAHQPGGDGESCPGGVRSLLPGQGGAISFREPGAPARGAQGVQPRGCSEPPARPMGGPPSPENRAHQPGGDGKSCPGGVRSLLQGPWGAIIVREPGAPAWGGRGVLPRGCSEPPAGSRGGHLLQRTGRTGPGGTGSPAQGVFGASCKADGGATVSREPGAPAWGGREVLPRGCSEPPARPVGGHLLRRTGRTGLGGTGSPAQGVFGASCQANGGPSSSENRAHRPGGGRGVQPRGCSESPARPVGGHLLQRTGRTGLGGAGSPAQGVFGVSCKASGGPSSSENRAHRPGGGGESSPGGVRSLLPGQWGAIFFRKPGAPARGAQGVQPRGCSEPPARPMGGPPSPQNRAHQPGGDGKSCPGGVRSLLQDPWGAIFFGEPGAPAWGGRGVLPKGCSEPPARPVGGHLLQRTGRTGLGGDGESSPGGVRSLLQGQWGAIFFREPGAPAWGGTGSPAQGVFGVSCKANGGPSSSENRAHRPGGGRGVQPRGCSESPARPVGGHLLQRTGRTGLGGAGSPAQGVFGVSCQANGGPSSSENRAHRPGGDGESCPGGVRSLLPGQWGAIFFGEPGAPARGGRGVLSRGCSEPPARPVGGYLPSKPPTPSPTTLCSKAVGQQYRGS